MRSRRESVQNDTVGQGVLEGFLCEFRVCCCSEPLQAGYIFRLLAGDELLTMRGCFTCICVLLCMIL
jgi:hypothetical protein